MTDKTTAIETKTDKAKAVRKTETSRKTTAVRKPENVQPLKSKEDIADMKQSLKRWCTERDYIMFLLGINTGLRASDLLQLKTEDVKGQKTITIKESKTAKKRTIYLDSVYSELNAYIDTLDSPYLFPSRKGTGPISVTQAYRALNKAANMVDLDNVGTHTMRKTFGYFHYQQNKDITLLQSILNHSTPEVTLRYIGITEEDKRSTSIALNL